MTQGISIHIGLNRVDPAEYGGWDGALSGCINDANSMNEIASAKGYASRKMLIDDQATRANVISTIGKAAKELAAGDILFISYSGHGGQVPDVNGDDEDSKDETWALYDGELIDDELYLLWSQFAEGVRIIVLSDSCHSGTISKEIPDRTRRIKQIPKTVQEKTYKQHEELYTAAQWMVPKGKETPVAASVLLISGCQDHQLSRDGVQNGAFTTALLNAWEQGGFQGSYRTFYDKIKANMPADQEPNFYLVGADITLFETQSPFSI